MYAKYTIRMQNTQYMHTCIHMYAKYTIHEYMHTCIHMYAKYTIHMYAKYTIVCMYIQTQRR